MKYGLDSFQQLEATAFLILFTQFPRIFTPPQFFARPVSVSFGRVAKWITLAMRVRVPDRGVCCTAEIQFLFHRVMWKDAEILRRFHPCTAPSTSNRPSHQQLRCFPNQYMTGGTLCARCCP